MSSPSRAQHSRGDLALVPPDRSLPETRASGEAPRGARWSLEHRLPVLISALLACVVGGLSFAAYREVRATAISRATDQLERVGRELNASAARSTAARTETLRSLASDSVIVRALRGTVASPAIAARLAAAREPADSTQIAWRLATVGGEARFTGPAGWTAVDSAALAATVAEVIRTGQPRRSTFHAVGERVFVWAAVPVLDAGRVVGTLAELRRVGDASGVDATIRELVDDAALVRYAGRGSEQWVSTRGRPVPAPFTRLGSDARARRVIGFDGVPYYAVQFTVPQTPWLIVMFQSEASVLQRPMQFLRALLGMGGLVLAIATAGAWLLSRYVTRPLREVTQAAAGLARGDYTRRVSASHGGSEVASLASTFNTMASGMGEAHATLAQRNAELQRANAAKAQFLAMMSHELRTPLNAIGGFTELIELGLRGPVTPEQVGDLARIRRNKDLLLSIITDILDFTRADAGALRLKVEPLRIASLLPDVVDALGRQIEAKGVRLELGSIPDRAVARGDREKVQQVMINLLSNALKFTDAGGEVGIDVAVSDGMVRIDVRDTGPGIDATQQDSIFEPFVQLDSSLTRRAGGTGLGLAIARQLAGAMGGTLTVRSTVNVGSTFTLSLPHADRPLHASASAHELRQPSERMA